MVAGNGHYDAVVIGCGMAGLAAGIRVAMAGQRVLVVERHNAPGGLNGFYAIGGRKYDVGLHAVTNYVPPGTKGAPLTKLCRQLRIDREALALRPQVGSRTRGGGAELAFTNDPAVLEAAVADRFPAEIDGWRRLVEAVRSAEELRLDAAPASARARVGEFLRDPLLVDLVFCPVQYYGSAWPDDMDWNQFVILFKALFLEGFARPGEGVRRIIRVMLDRFREEGGERRMKCGVRRLHVRDGRVAVVELDDGTEVTADVVLSSAGRVETERLVSHAAADAAVLGTAAAVGTAVVGAAAPGGTPVATAAPGGASAPAATDPTIGPLSFVETISVLDEPPASWTPWRDTITFFFEGERFRYRAPESDLVDTASGVICIPNHYRYEPGEGPAEGWLRVTALASHARWTALPEAEYRAAKEAWFDRVNRAALAQLPGGIDLAALARRTVARDCFTPRTIERFTGHLGGAVYGSTVKSRDGRTAVSNLHLCGTDQGFLGIVGAILSGISMANLHVIQRRG